MRESNLKQYQWLNRDKKFSKVVSKEQLDNDWVSEGDKKRAIATTGKEEIILSNRFKKEFFFIDPHVCRETYAATARKQ